MYKLFIIFALLTIACSDDGKENIDPSNTIRDVGTRDFNGGSDLGSTDSDLTQDLDDNSDAQSDTSGEQCAPLLDTTFDIQDKAQIGQLYARASWSGSTGWVIYAAPANEGDPEAIFLTRVSCEGEVITPPIQISPVGSPDRHLHPSVVSKNGSTFVTWYSQAGAGQTTIWFQSYKEDGSSITENPVDITPKTDEGLPISNLIWEPVIAASSDESALVAVSFASEDGFKIGIQKIDKEGVLGDFLQPINDSNDQKAPSVGVDDSGNISLSWIRENESESVSYLGNIPTGAAQIVPASGIPSKPLSTPNPLARVSKHASKNGTMFQAFQVTNSERSDILVRNATNLATANSLTFGITQNNYRPSIASANDGGAVAWYRFSDSPTRGKVILQSFNEVEAKRLLI